MDSLEGRIALVTGGGRGIGRSIAVALARAGADVAVAARSVPEIEAVAAEISALGRRTHFFPLDVSDRARLAAVPREVEAHLGPIDVLVNNAGIDQSGPVHRITDAEWDAVLAVDLTAPFLLTRACLPSMYERRFGRVVNVASVAGRTGLRYAAAYTAAKHGLVGFTRALALEGASRGVTANAVCPGWTETRMMDESVAAAANATGRTEEETRALFLRPTPLGRAALPDEVAEVAVLLARNAAMTGVAVNVDCGELMA
jgi:meso-butanediol dehydrogenase/(S,S)-butanediol dehydrogenase/diacetyl reductase